MTDNDIMYKCEFCDKHWMEQEVYRLEVYKLKASKRKGDKMFDTKIACFKCLKYSDYFPGDPL